MSEKVQTPANRITAAPVKPVTLGRIDFASVFDFVHVFRSFRLAINPAKIVIALIAIAMIYAAGRLFDVAWGPQVSLGEIEFFQTERREVYARLHAERRESRDAALQSLLMTSSWDNAATAEQLQTLKNSPRAAYRELTRRYTGDFHRDIQAAAQRRADSERSGSTAIGVDARSPREIEQDERAFAARKLQGRIRTAKDAAGRGIFEAFLDYELKQFDLLVTNTLGLVRLAPGRTDDGSDGASLSTSLVSTAGDRLYRNDTITGNIANIFITGPLWLFTGTAPLNDRAPDAGTAAVYGMRALYLVSIGLFAVFSYVVLVLSGGIIARLTALEFAGIERPLLKDIYSFVLKRAALFIRVPLTPVAIFLVVAVAIAALSLVGAVPVVGEVLLGIMFIVFIGIAFILMLLVLGMIGGYHLLVPAVAVESADAFDAMSRAFAYVYAKPWRLLLHTVVALIYGVITLLFLSFAVFILLKITHTFVGWGTSLFGYQYAWYAGVDKLSGMWPEPRFGRLTSLPNWAAMSWPEFIGAAALHFWVFTLVSSLGAYVVSYFHSSSTIVYMLLRRAADGQPVEEIYLDPEPAKAAAPVEAAPAPANANG